MNKTMIISEKPSQATRIATALSDDKVVTKKHGKVKYYEISRGKKKIVVVCAVGHLFNLQEKDGKGWTYPVFEMEWRPSHEISKSAAFSKPYLETIQGLVQDCDNFVLGTDKDLEGELIGANCLRFIAKRKDGFRMEFSTLTKEELVRAFENAKSHLDFPLLQSAETRHMIDYLAGINLSRALTLSIKHASNRFKILSIGRVQGPALALLAGREREIQRFKPKPYWELEVTGTIHALHKQRKFWDKKIVDAIYNKIRRVKKAVVESVKRKAFAQPPPHPFDLTALQLEAYRTLKITPKDTLQIAQQLYTHAYISYPRTSSNMLPVALGYKKIISNIAKQQKYRALCESLLQQPLTPNNGKKTDPAHPCIYPTGVVPKKLSQRQLNVYDLIVRRTLATFGPPATRQTITITLDIKGEPFVASGTSTLDPGWHRYYGRFSRQKEESLPEVNIGQELQVKEILLHGKETQPPKRYTPASIIKELEKRNLGTKATRSSIIDALYQRNYLLDTPIQVTDLGMKTIATLKKYCPDILDEKMTRELEEDLEEIREKKETMKHVLERAKKDLRKTLTKFKKHEMQIGKALAKATRETQEKASLIGNCNLCDGELRIMYSRKYKSRFIACNKYPKCMNTFSLPQGLPKPTGSICKECDFPVVRIIRQGRRPFDYCIYKECKLKLKWLEKMERITHR